MENKYLIVCDFSKNNSYSKLARISTNIFVKNNRHVRVRCLNGSINVDDSLDEINTVLQFCNPEDFKYYGPNSKSYGYCDFSQLSTVAETSVYHSLVDSVFSISAQQYMVYDQDVVAVKDKNERLDINYLNGDYVFFTANDDYNRSSTNIFLEAYMREFLPSEPVSCLIKTNRIIDEEIEYIKSSLGLYKNTNFYKKQVVINGDMPKYEQLKFLNTGDCYVYTGEHTHMGELAFLNKYYISQFSSVKNLMAEMRCMYNSRNSKRAQNNGIQFSKFLNSTLGENLS